jgi:hypothetical protein
MKKILSSLVLALAVSLASLTPAHAQQNYSGQSVVVYQNYIQSTADVFTAASTNGVTHKIGALNSGVIHLVGVSLTTSVWSIQGSTDGGATWLSLPTAAYPTTAAVTTTAVTQTSTASGFYVVNLVGFNAFRFITTSGTFTGTSIGLTLNASSVKGLY